MSEITQIGLGKMGSALAHALLAGGRRVTVWNRNAAKASALVASGARAAESLADALRASPVIQVCIDGYASTFDVLGAERVAPNLADKTVIQLSTGTPRDARKAENWFRERSAGYLDGKILGGPHMIGRNALILVAGEAATFERCRAHLSCLTGNLRYVGPRIGAAATLDLAWLSEYFGFFLGAIHGVTLCEAELVGVDQYASVFAEGSRTRWLLDVIHSGRYENPTATLAVWYEGLRRIQDHARETGINHEVPDFAAGIFRRAIAAGHGEEDVAALVKVLRAARGTSA
jgi:3-hydroxyisobutyrate dehydrogenase-like beta-hydroxyacid dehydrogenase